MGTTETVRFGLVSALLENGLNDYGKIASDQKQNRLIKSCDLINRLWQKEEGTFYYAETMPNMSYPLPAFRP
jgi:hypothetical protein